MEMLGLRLWSRKQRSLGRLPPLQSKTRRCQCKNGTKPIITAPSSFVSQRRTHSSIVLKRTGQISVRLQRVRNGENRTRLWKNRLSLQALGYHSKRFVWDKITIFNIVFGDEERIAFIVWSIKLRYLSVRQGSAPRTTILTYWDVRELTDEVRWRSYSLAIAFCKTA